MNLWFSGSDRDGGDGASSVLAYDTADERSGRETPHSVTMEADIPSDAGVTMYQSTRRHGPEDSNLNSPLRYSCCNSNSHGCIRREECYRSAIDDRIIRGGAEPTDTFQI